MATYLTPYIQRIANDFRTVRPTKADQRRNPDIDVMAVWRDDIAHSARCQELTPEQTEEFRRLCGDEN